MVNIPMNTCGPVTKQSVLSINQLHVQAPKSSQDIKSLNVDAKTDTITGARCHPAATNGNISQSVNPKPTSLPSQRALPVLHNIIQKGQKVPLETNGRLSRIKVCLGWNTSNSSCDIDVSAFLLGASGKVLGDTWFVFYGQTLSPDASTCFSVEQGADRETITIDFSKMNPSVNKAVFVLTINEALQKNLNFSMVSDAYIRVIDLNTSQEIVSFKMDEYYSNVTSMMIGEIYRHNGQWKFNAIGNGVARDLAGLCEFYGVEVE